MRIICKVDFPIYEVQYYPDNTYRATLIYSCRYTKNGLMGDHDFRDCMHIAWITREELLEALD